MVVPKNRGKCKSATISLHRGDSLTASGPPAFQKKKLDCPHLPQERTEYTFKLHKSWIDNKTDN